MPRPDTAATRAPHEPGVPLEVAPQQEVRHGAGDENDLRILPGAVVAVASWAAASLLFSFLLGVFPDHGALYGGLGTAISLLLYLYFSAAVLLFDAELNAAMHRGNAKGEGNGGRLDGSVYPDRLRRQRQSPRPRTGTGADNGAAGPRA